MPRHHVSKDSSGTLLSTPAASCMSLVWTKWWQTPSPGPQQVKPSSHRRLACVPGHLWLSSVISQQVLPSCHRRQACVPGHLRLSSVISQQVLPGSHRRLACVPGQLQLLSISFSRPLFSSQPVWTSRRCLQPRGLVLPPWPAKRPSGLAQQPSRGVSLSVTSPLERPAHCYHCHSSMQTSPTSTP